MSWLGGIAGGLGKEGESIERARKQRIIETLNQQADVRSQKELAIRQQDASLRQREGEQTIRQRNAPEVQYISRPEGTYAVTRDPNTGLTKSEKVEGIPGTAPDMKPLGVPIKGGDGKLYQRFVDDKGQVTTKPLEVPKGGEKWVLKQDAQNSWVYLPADPESDKKPVQSGVKGRAPAAHRDPLQSLQDALAKSDYIAARKIVNDAQKDTLASQKLMATMDAAKDKAIKGDQQAQFAITANHILMTAGQKGGRVSQAMYKQAEESAPMIGRIEARFGPDGYLSGVVLTPQQINSMVALAHEKVRIQQQTLNDTKQTYAGDLSLRKDKPTTSDDNDPMGIRK